MSRNDAHSPTNLVTEDYEYLFAADLNSPWAVGLASNPEGREFLRTLNNYDPSLASRGQGQCHHCGAHLRYAAWLRHVPTGYTIVVGETCLDNRFGRATADFQALRKQVQLDREAQRIKAAIAAFVEANPDLAFMADKAHEHTNDFVADVARKLRRKGELTERQIEAVRRVVAREAEPKPEPAPMVPVVTGKVTIEGEVKSVKVQYSDFGATLKMLVLDDRGFKVWGTVPSKLSDGIDRVWGEMTASGSVPDKGVKGHGRRVRFSATVEASHDDETFGFFKRPTKAEFTDNLPEEED
jgi:hypothetical protein